MSATNYIQDDTGNTYIPPSQRPDGTWRRAIRVKDGYVPQDEQPLYVSRGRQGQTPENSPYPVGLSAADFNHSSSNSRSQSQTQSTKALYFEIGKYEPITKIPGLNFVQDSSANDPADEKKSKKKKKNKSNKSNENEIKISEPFTPTTKKPAPISTGTGNAPNPHPPSAQTQSKPENVGANNIRKNSTGAQNQSQQGGGSDPVKRLRNLKKKLKDIESLEQKVKAGELKNPDKDQLDKIHRKDEVLDQIDELTSHC